MLRLTLALAAAPTFAVMALLSPLSGGEAMCASSPSSMAVMYALMAAFHLAPWLKLTSRGRSDG